MMQAKIFNKGVLRKGDLDEGQTNIGQKNYITQQRTNVTRSKQNGELVISDNLPYKRRFN